MKKPAFALVSLFLLVAPALAQEGGSSETDHSAMGHGAASDASKAYRDSMSKMDTSMRAMKMTGKPGHDFAAMMIPHHEAAVAMAKAYLASGEQDPELTEMANEIIAAQQREIAELKAWLTDNAN